jgi:hypothetical protein
MRALIGAALLGMSCGIAIGFMLPRGRSSFAAPESSVARGEGLALLEQAQAARRWSDDEANTLRRLLPRMTPADRELVVAKLVAAINGGALQVSTRAMPF